MRITFNNYYNFFVFKVCQIGSFSSKVFNRLQKVYIKKLLTIIYTLFLMCTQTVRRVYWSQISSYVVCDCISLWKKDSIWRKLYKITYLQGFYNYRYFLFRSSLTVFEWWVPICLVHYLNGNISFQWMKIWY